MNQHERNNRIMNINSKIDRIKDCTESIRNDLRELGLPLNSMDKQLKKAINLLKEK